MPEADSLTFSTTQRLTFEETQALERASILGHSLPSEYAYLLEVNGVRPEAKTADAPDHEKPPETGQTDRMAGLALSGGGIRSATFSLGVLQSLAKANLLEKFEYLSTVSGGGYIGSWLSAWIARSDLKTVQNELAKTGQSEAPQVTWLRRYSNYLTPRVGLLSLDSLTIVSTWIRNVFLNQVVLLSVLSALFVAAHVAAKAFGIAAQRPVVFGHAAIFLGLLVLGTTAFNLAHQALPVVRKRNWLISVPGVVTAVLTPLCVAIACAAIWIFQPGRDPDDFLLALGYVGVALFVFLCLWIVVILMNRGKFPSMSGDFAYYALAGLSAVGVLALALAAAYTGWQRVDQEFGADIRHIVVAATGPPIVLAALILAITIFTGVAGRTYYERSREWWSRLNAWLVMLGGLWLLWFALAFLSAPLLKWVAANSTFWIALLGSSWIGSLVLAVLVRRAPPPVPKKRISLDTLVNVAAIIFVAGLLIVVAAATSAVLHQSSGEQSANGATNRGAPAVIVEMKSTGHTVDLRVSNGSAGYLELGAVVAESVHAAARLHAAMRSVDLQQNPVLLTLVVLLAIVLLFGWRVDINKFSLHNMYKNRLVRCYLGASNQDKRNAQPFTGLDDKDDIPLCGLGPASAGAPAQRPFHIFNTALNLSQGANLAWQERKAASFSLTPIACGYALARTQGDSSGVGSAEQLHVEGYRHTSAYAARDHEEKGFTLGMAMATSGAALSPNMGHATHPVRAFVLTLLNVRLGRWSPNPTEGKWQLPSPRFGLICLLQELFGYSNESRSFVYLSDGGHFENLGIYELVRRQCKTIVVVDAGEDERRRLDDLSEAIRKCRIDLGATIDLPNLDDLRSFDGKPPKRAFAEGTISFRDGSVGRIFVLKPTLTEDRTEPADIFNYASRNPTFPHQSTADQFFDESQFESYRLLGEHIGTLFLKAHEGALGRPSIKKVVATQLTQIESVMSITRWLGALFRYNKSKLPTRVDGIIDFFVLGAILSPALWTLVAPAIHQIFDVPAFLWSCISLTGCQEQVELLGALSALGVPFWKTPILYILQLDALLATVTAATIATGFVVATKRPIGPPEGATRGRWRAILLAVLIVAWTLSLVRDFLLMEALGANQAPVAESSTIAAIATVAAWSSIACLLATIGLARRLRKVWKARWKAE